jgi:hypothetical protein
MMPPLRRTSAVPRPGRWAAVGAALVAVAVAMSCNDPQSPTPVPPVEDPDWTGVWTPGSGSIQFHLEGTSGQATSLVLVASDLVFDSELQELHAQVSIRNTGTESVAGPEGVQVGGFDPNGVQPVNAMPLACPLCVPCPCPFPWMFDHRGSYGEDGLLTAGETSAPVEWILADPSAESFAFRARVRLETAGDPGTISGFVFVDANRDGTRDAGEAGIASVPVSLVHGENSQLATTDGNGHYSFSLAEAGLYEVVCAPASGCEPTTPLRRQVFIVRRADGTLSGYDHANFGCAGGVRPDSGLVFMGMVFNDLNRDGVHQMGEPGIAGVGITGGAGCPTFAPIRTITDARGTYRLAVPTCAPPYSIGHDPVTGFVDTSPNPLVFGADGPLPADSLPGGPPNGPPAMPPVRLVLANFGVAGRDSTGTPASVQGFVFRDANRNGLREPGEPGIAGVRVIASSMLCMTPVLAQTETDSDGHYRIDQPDVHCPPPWMVGHDPVANSCDTSPNPILVGGTTVAPVTDPVTTTFEADFGVASCDTLPPPPAGYSIVGAVYLDANGNGQRDPGEAGIPDVEISLESICTLWRATRTDAAGYYNFPPEVVARCPVLAVRQVLPVFPVHTTPNPVPVDPSQVPPGGALGVDFGVRRLLGPQR